MWQNIGDFCIAEEPRVSTKRLANVSGLLVRVSERLDPCALKATSRSAKTRRRSMWWHPARAGETPCMGSQLSCEEPSLVSNSPTHTHTGSKNTHMRNFPHREEVSVTGARPRRFEVRPTPQTPWRSAATHAHTHAHTHTHPKVAPCGILPTNSSTHSHSTRARQCRVDGAVPQDRARSLDYVIGFQTQIKSRTNRVEEGFYSNTVSSSQQHTHTHTAKGLDSKNDTSLWLLLSHLRLSCLCCLRVFDFCRSFDVSFRETVRLFLPHVTFYNDSRVYFIDIENTIRWQWSLVLLSRPHRLCKNLSTESNKAQRYCHCNISVLLKCQTYGVNISTFHSGAVNCAAQTTQSYWLCENCRTSKNPTDYQESSLSLASVTRHKTTMICFSPDSMWSVGFKFTF